VNGWLRTRHCCSGGGPTRYFAGFWPKQTDNPFTGLLNRVQKYVATRTLSESLWENSTLLAGDARDTGPVRVQLTL
jgi:hypothetical protein